MTATYWAGPALVTTSEPVEPAVAVLVLWRRSSPHPDGDDSRPPERGDLLERGYAPVPGPAAEHLRRLPPLPGAAFRLPADGRRLRIDDGAHPLFDVVMRSVSDDWHTAARSDGLVLLVNVEPVPDRAGTAEHQDDPGAWALTRMTEACRAENLFGARIGPVAAR